MGTNLKAGLLKIAMLAYVLAIRNFPGERTAERDQDNLKMWNIEGGMSRE